MIAALDARGERDDLLKTADAQDVLVAIHAVMRGEVVLDPAAARVLGLGEGSSGRAAVLSPREFVLLRLAARGDRTKEIAATLALSTRTVEGHLTSFNKLGVSSRTEAIVHAAAG